MFCAAQLGVPGHGIAAQAALAPASADRRSSPPTTFRISAWWPLATPTLADSTEFRCNSSSKALDRYASANFTTLLVGGNRHDDVEGCGVARWHDVYERLGTCAAEASRRGLHVTLDTYSCVPWGGAALVQSLDPQLGAALGARTELAKPTTAETEWLAKELSGADAPEWASSIDSILLEDDVNAYLNPTLSAQVKTLAKLAPSWTPIVNAVEFADSTAHAAAVARAGFGVASPELYQIDGDRCADCATDATGAGCSPRRRTAAHSRQSAVWSADDAEMALGDTAAAAGAGASVRLAAPAQPASLCDESRGGYAPRYTTDAARATAAMQLMAAVDTWGRAAEAADVIFSPLLNLGDAGDTGVVRDGQLVSFQGFAAIAYGARGLSWYCWVHGALEPTKDIHWPTYDAVRTVNSHARAWAPALFTHRRFGGAWLTPPRGGGGDGGAPPALSGDNELDDHRMKDPLLAPGERGHADGDGKSRTRSPGAGELIVEMSAHLLATVHASEGCDSPTKAAKGCTLLLAIVDLRLWHLDKATATADELADGATVAGVDGGEGEVPLDLRPLPARTVTVKLSGEKVRRATPVAPTVAAAAEAGGDGGDVVVSAQLRGGGGALFELQWD